MSTETNMNIELLRPNRLRITPRAKREIRRLCLDSSIVKGTGPNGRIVFNDVIDAGKNIESKIPNRQPEEKTSSMRLAVAKSTSESFRDIPHFYLKAEFNSNLLINTRQQMVEMAAKENLPKITLTDFFIKAIAIALNEVKQANRLWRNGTIQQLTEKNVGLIIGLDEGVIIGIIENADKLSLAEIAEQRIKIVSQAREGKYIPSAKPCTISLSNLGPSIIDEFCAIIPPTQSSVFAIGRSAKRPYVIDNKLFLCNTIKMVLSLDHRVMDGLHGAQLLEKIAELLEDPNNLSSLDLH